MKFYLTAPALAFMLTGCSVINLVNESTAAIEANKAAVEQSTEAINRNREAVEKSNAAIEENRRKLEEINNYIKSIKDWLPI